MAVNKKMVGYCNNQSLVNLSVPKLSHDLHKHHAVSTGSERSFICQTMLHRFRYSNFGLFLIINQNVLLESNKFVSMPAGICETKNPSDYFKFPAESTKSQLSIKNRKGRGWTHSPPPHQHYRGVDLRNPLRGGGPMLAGVPADRDGGGPPIFCGGVPITGSSPGFWVGGM